MTEEEWLKETDPDPMLEFVSGKASERKLRLFACACVRQVWDQLTDEYSRQAVEVAERYADGHATAEAVLAAAAASTADPGGGRPDEAARWCCHEMPQGVDFAMSQTSWGGRSPTQAMLFRDLFGPLPFRPVTVNPSWLAWSDATVPKIAQSIYSDRRFDELPILADALEEAGCSDLHILGHLRGLGPHVRGCWVVDLVLGRS